MPTTCVFQCPSAFSVDCDNEHDWVVIDTLAVSMPIGILRRLRRTRSRPSTWERRSFNAHRHSPSIATGVRMRTSRSSHRFQCPSAFSVDCDGIPEPNLCQYSPFARAASARSATTEGTIGSTQTLVVTPLLSRPQMLALQTVWWPGKSREVPLEDSITRPLAASMVHAK